MFGRTKIRTIRLMLDSTCIILVDLRKREFHHVLIFGLRPVCLLEESRRTESMYHGHHPLIFWPLKLEFNGNDFFWEQRDAKTNTKIGEVISKNQALLDRLNASDVPCDSPYRINVQTVANYRILSAEESNGNSRRLVGLCNLGHKGKLTVEDLIEQADREMKAMDAYIER